uniref:low affinity immunoglobulin gamma Fc region receptor II-like n=1 Tax=Epinephelus lanceolatus TaxID=310571 RepID=UPI001444EBAF|nr:low affinity immunoglobulin gamma Fc region receptor II-like [Epinephelus lanceolatus]
MEVRALCIRLLVNVLMLLGAHVQQSYPQAADAAFRIVPTRLQFFEYESLRFNCEGFNVSAEGKVRNTDEVFPKCSNGTETSTVTCTIDRVFTSDSGEYWCEGGGGRSNSVNITVTAGSVILQSPVRPVMEGESVTLRCRNKTSSTNFAAVFYRNGRYTGHSSTGEMTIRSVSKSDEGLYKCYISGAGGSPESWMAVRGGDVIMESPALPLTEGEAVTLRCRNKKIPSDLRAGFYKDGLLIRNSSTGEMTISSVSKSDEGLYKCHISGAGGSVESWLAVRAQHGEACVCSDFIYVLLVLRTVFTIVMVPLLLLLVGLLHRGKLRVTQK